MAAYPRMVQVANCRSELSIFLANYPRLYRVQHVVVVGAEGLPLVRLDWLLGASALGVPPEGAIALPLFWEQWV